LIIAVVGFGFSPKPLNFEDPDPILACVLYIFYIYFICSSVGLCYYFWKKLRQFQLNPRYLIGNKFTRYRWWSLLRLVTNLLLFSFGIRTLLIYVVPPSPPSSLEIPIEELALSFSSLPIIYKFLETIAMVVVLPITQEFIFRGLLLHRFTTKWNIAIAIWASSIIFGLLHPGDLFGTFLFGVVMALLYIKTKTLIVPIVAHAMYNTIAILFGILAENDGTIIAKITTETISGNWILSLLFVATSLPFLIQFIYRHFPAKNQASPYFANEAQAISQMSD